MKTYDMTSLAREQGFVGKVRISERVMDDWIYVAAQVVSDYGITPIERLQLLLQDVAYQLSQYPGGTQAVRLTHFRIPPSGSPNQPLALELEVLIVQGDRQHGDYLLVARHDELNHALLAAA
ncbi:MULTISPECIES: hypothetical protein [unclassified Halomonas]|uniref:hypothetical protein n=1 Tax=unclassified Halomonas TaxID=2609666 RepID=UPI002884B841|nr:MULTISPECIES: hypothetical protein [unclassified Halomonas]MDT0501342.1 hypothetical protein [Halomonas sp. PAR7]MDT0512134.1 hypothetical protein [Halomonas sp. LES1]MDT0590729.1 hypothetical protein [Halomonas sp. PAR8]